MQGEILIAVLSFLGTCLGSWGGLKLMSYRIEQLEKKVQAHNNLIERTYKLEDAQHLLDERIKVANHRIDDLEKAVTAE